MNPDQVKLQDASRMTIHTHREHVLFAIACAILITLFVTAYFQVSSAIQSMHTLDKKTEYLDVIDGLLIDLLSAETGVRGYLITGKRNYLQPYSKAVSDFDLYLDRISNTATEVGISEEVLTELALLIERYKRIFAELIVDKLESENIDNFNVAFGKDIFDQLRLILLNIKKDLEADTSTYYRESLKRQSRARLAFFALCTAAFVLLLWLFSTQQRQAQLRQKLSDVLARENETLEFQVQRRTKQLTQLAANLTRVNEAEKKRLARELHDDLGASLTAAKMDASWISTQMSEADLAPIRDKISRLIQSLDSAITLKRRLTSDLLPPLLSELGLHEALRSLAEDLERDGVFAVETSIPEAEPDFSPDAKLALFRITQEAFTNIRKYSKATIVKLSIERIDDEYLLQITDNGVGFDPRLVSEESFGLVSMHHRAHMIAAELEVDSQLNKGTSIITRVALN